MSAPPTLPSLSQAYVEEYSGDSLRDVIIAFAILEIVFVGLRYISQVIGTRPWGLDDGLMILALIFNLGQIITSLVSLRLGKVGYHLLAVEETHPDAIPVWAKTLIATPIIYSVAVCLPKLVLLLLYHRVFTTRTFHIANYLVMTMVIVIALVDIFLGAFQCTPVNKLWDHTVEGTCIDIPQAYRYGTLPNAITDGVKIGLSLTFLTGSVGTVTSVMRCVAFFQNNPLIDGTWASVIFLRWSIVEPGCYLIAACLPTYRPLLRYLKEKLSSSQANVAGDSTLLTWVTQVFDKWSKSSSARISSSAKTAQNTFDLNSLNGQHAGKKQSDEEMLVSASDFGDTDCSESCFAYFDPTRPDTLVQALNQLDDYIRTEGPFDGMLAYSHGAQLAASYLSYLHQRRPRDKCIKCVVFISGGVPYELEDNVVGVCTADSLVPLVTAEATSTSLYQMSPHRNGVQVYVPAANIWGEHDELYPGSSKVLSRLCWQDWSKVFIHGGGHDIPTMKAKDDLLGCVKTIRRVVDYTRCLQ
ncbi:MAG: hypothetical protein Q9159_004697 [Coniocarpon cinnabarinum]